MASADSFDVAVVGAGPAGAVAALAYARAGAKVALLEASPKAAQVRLAGEWLHPPVVEALEALGVGVPEGARAHDTGRGFAVFPDDSDTPIVLPYPGGRRGLCCDHHALVDTLRAAAADAPGVSWLPDAKVTGVMPRRLTYERRGETGETTLSAGRIVGADGRASVVRRALGLDERHVTVSRMAGLVLEGAELPFEGYGHVLLGGYGPILMYRLAPGRVRLILDVPLGDLRTRSQPRWLWEAYAPRLPEELRPAFRRALAETQVAWAANHVRPRGEHGTDALTLIGDAVGHYHPLTALGITFGVDDARTLAVAGDFDRWRRERRARTRVPEMLAVQLYEVFADDRDDARAIRRAVYAMWRASALERERTMGFLECRNTRASSFAGSFAHAVSRALVEVGRGMVASRDPAHALGVATALGRRMKWVASGALSSSAPTGEMAAASKDRESPDRLPAPIVSEVAPAEALSRGVAALVAAQGEDGAWEGEVVWCAMLPSQYALACHVAGREIDATRRARLLLQLRRTQRADGTWGLHPRSRPYLFTTALAYVAARLLGEDPGAAWLARARAFIRGCGGLDGIPSWGKLWLALVGLARWEDVPPVLPEAWQLPRALPMHPSKWYCHTRLIYLAMSALRAREIVGPATELVAAVRDELTPTAGAYEGSRWSVRAGDLHVPQSLPLRAAYRVADAYDRVRKRLPFAAGARERLLADVERRLRWELRTTDHTSISPVSGLLNLLALGASSAEGQGDADVVRGWARFEGWIWEDDVDGTRIAGARSASWDTAFALTALERAGGGGEAHDLGRRFLASQQIRRPHQGFADNDRIDPTGGWCFAGVWHGWPVSDCTAEALVALMGGDGAVDDAQAEDGTRFILRCQNADGGFGSYEARRSRVGLEWLNPAEMFGASMTEGSYVECTASCVEALVAYRARYEGQLSGRCAAAIERATRWLRRAQRPDGSWAGVWGVSYVYGTMFGVRGLRAAGAGAYDPALTRAARWTLARQRADGSWGEHEDSGIVGRYVARSEADGGLAVQTAWALLTLVEAGAADDEAIERGAAWLAARQGADGRWPSEDMTGVFFETSLLEYALYRQIFPVWALGAVEARRASLDEAFPVADRRARAAAR